MKNYHPIKRLYLAYFIVCSVLFAGSFAIYNFSIGPWPALGMIFDPFHGIWQNYTRELPEKISSSYLKSKVIVQRDTSGIPHIFAENEEDLYFSQGYIHAFDRLFQMELQARWGGARLSELLGKKTQDRDLYSLKVGARESAERILEYMDAQPILKKIISAYIKGVNAYVGQLDPKEYPIEYKLLGAKPKHFEKIDIANFLVSMYFNLAGRSYDLEFTRLFKKWGKEVVYDLFPLYPQFIEPIVSDKNLQKNGPYVREFSNTFVSSFAEDYPEYLGKWVYPAGPPDDGSGKGSNNWAVSKTKTKSGFNILANDTHLGLNLPVIWYEMQLVSKNQNVYGGSFPGVPGIMIGQNDQIAWGVTNSTFDITDFYEVEFKDETFQEYKFENQWLPVKKKTHLLFVKGEKPKKVILIWTHQGVVVAHKGSKALVVKSELHQPGKSLGTYLGLDRAQNYNQCLAAIHGYHGPMQNFICMDSHNYGIFPTGTVPLRRKHQGFFVLDGSKKENDLKETIPQEKLPFVANPQSGFVGSANQHPAGPSYAQNMGWYFDDSYRAHSIYKFLRESNQIDVPYVMKMQNSNYDAFAEQAVPILVQSLMPEKLTTSQAEFLKSFSIWNFQTEANSYETTFFYEWWPQLMVEIWSDELWAEGSKKVLPKRSRTLRLLTQALHGNREALKWIVKEPLSILGYKKFMTASFQRAWSRLSRIENSSDDSKWLWWKYNNTQLQHPLRIPAFSSKTLEVGGSQNSINANKGFAGPTWRMIVELSSPHFQMWTSLPGGISGQPTDKSYRQFIEMWRKGEYKKAVYMFQPEKNLKTTYFESKK